MARIGGGISRIAASWGVPADAALPLAYLVAGIGGAIGVMAALVPVVLLRDRLLAVLPLRAIGIVGGALLLLTGGIMALSALALL